jgi:replicative DNA helicase
VRTTSLQPISTLVNAYLERLGQPPSSDSWSTGLPDLDSLTGGLSPGKLWAIVGRPGAGKSVLALGMARQVAIHSGGRAIVLAQRDTPEQQARRVLSAEAGVPLIHLRDGALAADDMARLEGAKMRLDGANLLIAQASDPVLAALALEEPDAPSPNFIVVDGVPVGYRRVAHFHELRRLAQALCCTVLAVLVHAPPRSTQEDEASLGADVVLRLDDWSASDRRAGEADLVVTYHREGPVMTIALHNQAFYARFVEAPSG